MNYKDKAGLIYLNTLDQYKELMLSLKDMIKQSNRDIQEGIIINEEKVDYLFNMVNKIKMNIDSFNQRIENQEKEVWVAEKATIDYISNIIDKLELENNIKEITK